MAPPFTEAEFDIRWGVGIDTIADLVEVALTAGVLEKSGTHLTLGGKSIGQGRDRARDNLAADAALLATLRAAVLEALPSQAHRLTKKAAA